MNKLAELNSIPLAGFSAMGGELEYVHAKFSRKVKEFLILNGIPESKIKEMLSDDGKVIELGEIGFSYFGAKWFQKSKGGFLDHVPDDAPEWCKTDLLREATIGTTASPSPTGAAAEQGGNT